MRSLTERQKSILQEEGLSTEFEELTVRQRSAIMAIEEMLNYLEKKYQEEFVYSGYVSARWMDKEHLLAWPKSGASSEIVTVYRNPQNAEEGYMDNYILNKQQADYQQRIRAYLEKEYGEDTSAYVRLNPTEADYEQSAVSKVAANVSILIRPDSQMDALLPDIARKYGVWLKNEDLFLLSSTLFLSVSAEDFKTADVHIEKVDYSGFHYSAKCICEITSNGEIRIR